MMNKDKYEGFEDVTALTGDFEKVDPGAYICRIRNVTLEEKPYGDLLRIEFDIAEGKYKDYYKRKQEDFGGDWKGMYYQTAMKDNKKFFKGFTTAIEKSNEGYQWNWDEQSLVGKFFGGVFAEEEYQNDKGEVKISCKCVQVRSVEQVKNGKIKIPEIKRLNPQSSNSQGFTDISGQNDVLPF